MLMQPSPMALTSRAPSVRRFIRSSVSAGLADVDNNDNYGYVFCQRGRNEGKMARSKWIEDLEWVRPGLQTRSQRTQAKLLDAAAELFADKGLSATTVADIAARAGCTTGAVYHHFKDKQALLFALLQRMSEEYRATIRAAVDPTHVGRALAASRSCAPIWSSRWRPVAIGPSPRARPSRSRERTRASASTSPRLRSELNDGLLALMMARRDEFGHPQPETAAKFVLDLLGSLISTRLDELLLPTYLAHRPDGEFVDEALAAASAYLGVRAN